MTARDMGVYRFNVTVTSSGEFSEVTQNANLTLVLTVKRTHDMAVTSTTSTRNFAYNNTSGATPLIITIGILNQGSVSETYTLTTTATGDPACIAPLSCTA